MIDHIAITNKMHSLEVQVAEIGSRIDILEQRMLAAHGVPAVAMPAEGTCRPGKSTQGCMDAAVVALQHPTAKHVATNLYLCPGKVVERQGQEPPAESEPELTKRLPYGDGYTCFDPKVEEIVGRWESCYFKGRQFEGEKGDAFWNLVHNLTQYTKSLGATKRLTEAAISGTDEETS